MTQTLSANVNGNIPNVAYNDLYLDKERNISVSFDQEALLEQCAQAAKTLLGELIFNVDVGIPYFQSVWIGVPNMQQFNVALRRSFLSIPNVIEVLSLVVLQSDKSDVNTINYNAVIRTIYGLGELNGWRL